MHLSQARTEFLSGYFSTHERRKKTMIGYRFDLAQFCDFAGEELGLLSLDCTAIEQWAAHLRQEGYSPASIRRKMVVLRVFCSYWVRKGALSESPFWRVKLSFGRMEQLPRTLTMSEMRALLSQASRNLLNIKIEEGGEEWMSTRTGKASTRGYRALRNLALIDILFSTGIRVGEASALDINDFVVEEAVFRVQGKGGRWSAPLIEKIS